jgi:DNA recombination protein RmuC
MKRITILVVLAAVIGCIYAVVRNRQVDEVSPTTALEAQSSTAIAGENIVEIMFSKLPPEWQVRDFSVGNKVVEFGMRLPNDLVLPIDSKWTASSLLEEFAKAEDLKEKQRIKSQIQSVVLGRAAEIKKYIDPNLTASFGIPNAEQLGVQQSA